jgi:hypothetical protein
MNHFDFMLQRNKDFAAQQSASQRCRMRGTVAASFEGRANQALRSSGPYPGNGP